jgi:hypothetical protein
VPFQTPRFTFLASPVTGQEWGLQLVSVGGRPPYTWVVSGGTLPTGWVVNPNGDWFGTSTVSGPFSFTLTGSDANGTTSGGPVTGTLVASGPSPFAIGAFTLPTFGVGEDLGFEPPVEGGTPPYLFTVTGLPPGVMYDPATGTLMGRPTAAGMFPVSFALRDSLGNIASNSPQTVTLNVSSCQSTGGNNGGPSPGSPDAAPDTGSDASNSVGTPQCRAPQAQLVIDVTAQECSACTRLFIVAKSAQITAAIMSGQSPCAQAPPSNYNLPGCMVSGIWVDTFADCGGTSCGPYTWNLADDFAPALSGAAPAITDTVELCPFDCADAACSVGFKPAGTCISSTTNDLCDPNATITMVINGTVSP